MFSTAAAIAAIVLPTQIPGQGPASTPSLRVAPLKTYLMARDTAKPTLEIQLPGPAGVKIPPPLAAPIPVLNLRLSLNANVVQWLQDADERPIWDFRVLRCDAAGKIYQAVDLNRVRISSIGFPSMQAVGGGVPVVEITLTPTTSVTNKSVLTNLVLPRYEPPMRIGGVALTLKDKPYQVLRSIDAFSLNLAAATEYSTTFMTNLSMNSPVTGTSMDSKMTIKLTSAGRPDTNLILPFKSAQINHAGPQRAQWRCAGVGIR